MLAAKFQMYLLNTSSLLIIAVSASRVSGALAVLDVWSQVYNVVPEKRLVICKRCPPAFFRRGLVPLDGFHGTA